MESGYYGHQESLYEEPDEALESQYPDPEDVATHKYPWGGDLDDYVPAALQEQISNLEDQPGRSAQIDLSPRPATRTLINPSLPEDNIAVDPDYLLNENEEDDEGDLLGHDSDSEFDIDDDPGPQSTIRARGRGARVRTGAASKRGLGGRGRRGRRGANRGRWSKGVKRGLRAPIEPAPEFKALHSEATMAYIDNDYDRAEDLALEALQINPEMFPAHSLLAQIHTARGDADKALIATWNGAHTRPRDTQNWKTVAHALLDRDEVRDPATIRDAIYCYNRILQVSKDDIETRYARAELYRELSHFGRVAHEYEQLGQYLPHDTSLLRHLAEACIDLNEPSRALGPYQTTLAHYRALEPDYPTSITWSDVNIVAELHSFHKSYEAGLLETKSLSRWLLGRSSEAYWDKCIEDDREWDTDHEPRRIEVSEFFPNQYDEGTYGDGLPLELRIKLGIFRLQGHDLAEAMRHFDFLDPEDDLEGARLFDYPDLFREAATSLQEHKFYKEALRFYEPLQQVPEYADGRYLHELASCYAAMNDKAQAEDCYRTILDNDEGDEQARERLTEMTGGPKKQKASYGSVYKIRGKDLTAELRTKPSQDEVVSTQENPPEAMLATRLVKTEPRKSHAVKKAEIIEDLQALFLQRQSLIADILTTDKDSKSAWMTLSEKLTTIFAKKRTFYPIERHMEFKGYHPQASRKKVKPQEMDGTPENLVDNDVDASETNIPNEFGGISFQDWLDIFLEYALALAREDDRDRAYQTIMSAEHANVFFHSRESMFLIKICHATCALLMNDDQTFCEVGRYILRDYQFVSDGYRFFSALNRLSDSDHVWYNSGPTQKYILRQIKVVDFSLASDEHRERREFQERAALTTKDEEGNLVEATDMDVNLLMLYGHILCAGRSDVYGLNYFLRALALDPDNPVIKFSIGLAYIHHSLKRQVDNRHLYILQGIHFLMEYHDTRFEGASASEHQEAEYNVGRAHHLLGLTHLAIPYYERALDLSVHVQEEYGNADVEDFAQEAALALQGLWAASGNMERALEVTEQWLQL